MKYAVLKDKIVMVTGASSGLGESIARAFAENQSKVYMGARSAEKLKALASEIGATPLTLDVTEPTEVNAAAQHIIEQEGRIDIWVNNAGGLIKESPLTELTPELLHEVTAVNHFGLVYGTQAAGKQMKKQGEGDIVQILSTSSFTPRENQLPYCCAKAAAKMASQIAQKELGPYGIRVMTFEPGGMGTPFFDKAGIETPQSSMRPADIADTVRYSLSQPRNINTNLILYRQELR